MAKTTAEKSRDYRARNIEAYRKYKRDLARTHKHRKHRTEYMRKYRAIPENRKKHNESAKKSHARNRYKHIDKFKNYHLLRKYGITLTQKLTMVKNQDNQCLICKKQFWSSRSIHVDHDHETNKIRGILCQICNTKLEWYEKNKDSIINYLK